MNITAPQSGNITKLYRDAYLKEYPTEANIIPQSAQRLKFDTWRTYPVTQEFIKSLEDKRNNLLVRAMQFKSNNLDGNEDPIFLLVQARNLTQILSETIFTGELL